MWWMQIYLCLFFTYHGLYELIAHLQPIHGSNHVMLLKSIITVMTVKWFLSNTAKFACQQRCCNHSPLVFSCFAFENVLGFVAIFTVVNQSDTLFEIFHICFMLVLLQCKKNWFLLSKTCVFIATSLVGNWTIHVLWLWLIEQSFWCLVLYITELKFGLCMYSAAMSLMDGL